MESILKFWKNIEQKTKQMLPMQVFPAQVKEVDENNRTCTVRVNDNVDLYDVKLYAVTDKDLKGFCLIPATDSQVLVARIANGNDLFVCSFSVVDKVMGTIGDHTSLLVEEEHIQVKTKQVTIDVSEDKVTVDADKEDGIIINGGNNKGLVKVDKLTGQLNKIENDINELKTVFKSWTPVAQDGGGALKTAASKWIGSQLTLSKNENYEDTKIKH